VEWADDMVASHRRMYDDHGIVIPVYSCLTDQGVSNINLLEVARSGGDMDAYIRHEVDALRIAGVRVRAGLLCSAVIVDVHRREVVFVLTSRVGSMTKMLPIPDFIDNGWVELPYGSSSLDGMLDDDMGYA